MFLQGRRTEVESQCGARAAGRHQYDPVILHLTIAKDVAQCPTLELRGPPYIGGPITIVPMLSIRRCWQTQADPRRESRPQLRGERCLMRH